jgi:hypothetical protein
MVIPVSYDYTIDVVLTAHTRRAADTAARTFQVGTTAATIGPKIFRRHGTDGAWNSPLNVILLDPDPTCNNKKCVQASKRG